MWKLQIFQIASSIDYWKTREIRNQLDFNYRSFKSGAGRFPNGGGATNGKRTRGEKKSNKNPSENKTEKFNAAAAEREIIAAPWVTRRRSDKYLSSEANAEKAKKSNKKQDKNPLKERHDPLEAFDSPRRRGAPPNLLKRRRDAERRRQVRRTLVKWDASKVTSSHRAVSPGFTRQRIRVRSRLSPFCFHMFHDYLSWFLLLFSFLSDCVRYGAVHSPIATWKRWKWSTFVCFFYNLNALDFTAFIRHLIESNVSKSVALIINQTNEKNWHDQVKI